MKAMKDVKWEIQLQSLNDSEKEYFWISIAQGKIGVCEEFIGDLDFATEEEAKQNWIEFAKLNGITNYEFVEG